MKRVICLLLSVCMLLPVVACAKQELSWERATMEAYAENSLFQKTYAVSLVPDRESSGYTAATQLVFGWLISDATVKKQLSEVKKVSELFESATLFFCEDGSFLLGNHYAELMVKARRSFSTASEESLRTEIAYGIYEIVMEADGDGVYPITVTKENGSVLEFRFTPRGGTITGQQIFKEELYERAENASMPQKTITEYLTENGFLKKNSIDGAKADYHGVLTAKAILRESGKEMTVGELYMEAVVSFTEGGKAVITNHYTELGQSISGVKDESMTGTYTVSQESETGTTRHLIRVTLENETVDFYLDVVTGELTREGLFEEEPFVPFTTKELLANSGGGYAEESWSDADGRILTDVVYGTEQRNQMDIYIPSAFDPKQENAVILFLHGGSWVSGSKEEMANLCKKYAKLGYFTVAMNYSYAMSAQADGSYTTFLTIVSEIKEAFEKVKALSHENG